MIFLLNFLSTQLIITDPVDFNLQAFVFHLYHLEGEGRQWWLISMLFISRWLWVVYKSWRKLLVTLLYSMVNCSVHVVDSRTSMIANMFPKDYIVSTIPNRPRYRNNISQGVVKNLVIPPNMIYPTTKERPELLVQEHLLSIVPILF